MLLRHVVPPIRPDVTAERAAPEVQAEDDTEAPDQERVAQSTAEVAPDQGSAGSEPGSTQPGEEGGADDEQPQVQAMGHVDLGPPNWEERRSHLEALVTVLGHDWGTVLTDEDLFRIAEQMKVDVGTVIELEDAERLLDAYRQRASGVIRGLGHDHKERVTNGDLLRAAEILRIDVGTFADPHNIRQIIHAGTRHLEARNAGVRANLNAKTPIFASANGVAIHSPSPEIVLVGFHQAAFRGVSQLRHHKNVRMITLPSRRRATGSRSAADVSMPPATEVLSPVTGRVAAVQSYALYGRYPDLRMQIIPDDNPRMVLTVLHVTGARVKAGDRVEAGRTVIAREATKFPFTSQIDRFAGPLPHVHLELRRR
jgi:biotin carboxyl carrier protein